MYAFIRGKLDSVKENVAVVDNNGIGYRINVTASTLADIGGTGNEIKLYTHYQVKEDGHVLYGFLSEEEKQVFEKLITVSGVGCKTAIQILSSVSCNNLLLSIKNKDVNSLAAAKGVGKRTAERIILELKGKVDADDTIFGGAAQTAGANSEMNDAIAALTALGFPAAGAVSAIAEASKSADTAEGMIALALRKMNR